MRCIINIVWLLLIAAYLPIDSMQMLKNTLSRSKSIKKLQADLAELPEIQQRLEETADRAQAFWGNLQTTFNKPFSLNEEAIQISNDIEYLNTKKDYLKEYRNYFSREYRYKRIYALRDRMERALAIWEDFKVIDLVIPQEIAKLKDEEANHFTNKANEVARIGSLIRFIKFDPFWKIGREEAKELCYKIRTYKNFTADGFIKNQALIDLAESIAKNSELIQELEKKGLVKDGKIKMEDEWVVFY